MAFIQKECEEAAADLPLKVAAKDAGRATKGAAWALKGETELYAYPKWADAAATHKKIMESGAGYDLYPDYGALFLPANENNVEAIFDIQYAANIRGNIKEKYWNPVKVSDGGGWGAVNPTQNLADDYEFRTGKPKRKAPALFDPENPYNNRDKRFAATIISRRFPLESGVIYTRLGVANNPNELDASGAGGKGRTGYFMKKAVDPAVGPGNSSGGNSIIWRYAEVLLNYAEAQNEAVGPDESVYAAIKKVGLRAGLPELPANLTKDQMRARIRRREGWELAFEGKRFSDIRRWKTAEAIFAQTAPRHEDHPGWRQTRI